MKKLPNSVYIGTFHTKDRACVCVTLPYTLTHTSKMNKHTFEWGEQRNDTLVLWSKYLLRAVVHLPAQDLRVPVVITGQSYECCMNGWIMKTQKYYMKLPNLHYKLAFYINMSYASPMLSFQMELAKS